MSEKRVVRAARPARSATCRPHGIRSRLAKLRQHKIEQRIRADKFGKHRLEPGRRLKRNMIFMKTRRLLFICLLCLAGLSLRAQGTPDYLWTWNSGSGLFQGSFETPASYLTPNINVANGLYDLSFTSPDRMWTSNGNMSGDHTLFTYYGSNSFGMTIHDPSGEELQAGPFAIEAELNNQTLFSEAGSWKTTEIPEPSAAILLSMGMLARLSVRKKSNLSSLDRRRPTRLGDVAENRIVRCALYCSAFL